MTGVPPRPSTGGPPHLKQVIPTARAILWNPNGRRNPGGRYPLFIEQKALDALHEHMLAVKGQALIGFLVGDLFECPTSRVRYAVVDSTIRLNQPIYGDKTQVVVSRLWDRIQEELVRVGGQLIGWYHSHPSHALELAPGDIQTHEQYFTQPWHLAVVLGADRDGQPVAGVFRPGPGADWHSASQSFYELIGQEERLAAGHKASCLPWMNFESDDPLVTRVGEAPIPAPTGPPPPAEPRSTLEVFGSHAGPPAPPRKAAPPPPPKQPAAGKPTAPRQKAAAPPPPPAPAEPPAPAPPPPPAPEPPPPPPPRPSRPAKPSPSIADLPLLDVGHLPEEAPPPVAPTRHPPPVVPRPAARRPSPVGPRVVEPEPRRRRRGRGGALTVLGLLLMAAAGGYWYFVYRPAHAAAPPAQVAARPPRAARPAASGDTLLPIFDRLGDTLGLTIRAYNDRAKLYDGRQLDCAGLARGLAALEDEWTAYNVRGKSKVGVLDAGRASRDRALYTGVDSVERHFDRSGCVRP